MLIKKLSRMFKLENYFNCNSIRLTMKLNTGQHQNKIEYHQIKMSQQTNIKRINYHQTRINYHSMMIEKINNNFIKS